MRAQCQLSTAVAYGLNAFQAFVQRQTFFVDSKVYFAFFQVYRNCIVCSCINSDTVTCGIFSINSIDSVFQSFVCFLFIQCYIFTGNQCSMFTCFCCYIFQLAYVYCIGVGSTCCYTSNLASIINGNLVVKLDSAICKANAACACTGDGFNTSQSGVQCQTVAVNYEVLFAIFQLNFNLLLGDRNTIACSQSYACYLLIYVLYVGYRMIVSFINVGYVCIVGGHAV